MVRTSIIVVFNILFENTAFVAIIQGQDIIQEKRIARK